MPNETRNFKFIAVILFGVVLISVLSLGTYYIYDNIQTNQTDVGACSDRNEGSILSKAKIVFVDADTAISATEVKTLVEEINTLNDYDKDANCLYPIIYSYILDNNYEAADDLYDSFLKAYGDGSQFAKDIYPLQSPENLKNLIEFSLKLQQNNNIQPTPDNTSFSGDPIVNEQEENN